MFAISCNKRAMTLGTAGTFFCFFFSFFCGLWNLKSDDKKWRKKMKWKKKKTKSDEIYLWLSISEYWITDISIVFKAYS